MLHHGARSRNAGPEARRSHVLPTLWFRNTWSWGDRRAASRTLTRRRPGAIVDRAPDARALVLELTRRRRRPTLCSATTRPNAERLWGVAGAARTRRTASTTTSSHGAATVNPERVGTKAAFWYRLDGRARRDRRAAAAPAPAASAATASTRLRRRRWRPRERRGRRVLRRAHAGRRTATTRPRVMRQALRRDAVGQAVLPLRRRPLARRRPGAAGAAGRAARAAATPTGGTSTTSTSSRCPTPWEYPWFAAWDLAFHCVALAHVDPAFAKDQLLLLCREWYMHPNGQLPAYEWAFGDVNPPVHAWAALAVFEIDGGTRLRLPRAHLPQAAPQLHLVGQPQGRRRQQRLRGRLPRPRQHRPVRPLRACPAAAARAVRRHRVDGDVLPQPARDRARPRRARPRPTRTWRRSSSSTSPSSPSAIDDQGLWDEEDGFYYDLLRTARRRATSRCEVRSMVGLLPLLAVAVVDEPRSRARAGARQGFARPARHRPRPRPPRRPQGRAARRARQRAGCCSASSTPSGCGGILARLLDERRVPLALRAALAVSRWHREHPFALDARRRRRRARLRAGRVDDRPVRRQLQLARPDLVPGQLPRHRGAAALRRVLRRRRSRSSTRPARARSARSPRSPTTCARRLIALFLRRRRTAAGRASAGSTGSSTTRAGTTPGRSTSTSTATPAPASAPRTRPGWTGLVADLIRRRRGATSDAPLTRAGRGGDARGRPQVLGTSPRPPRASGWSPTGSAATPWARSRAAHAPLPRPARGRRRTAGGAGCSGWPRSTRCSRCRRTPRCGSPPTSGPTARSPRAGTSCLEAFELDDGVPRWRWRVGDVVLERELAMRHGRPAWRWCTACSPAGR